MTETPDSPRPGAGQARPDGVRRHVEAFEPGTARARAHPLSPIGRAIVYGLMLLAVTAVGSAVVIHVDVVETAPGMIIPSGQVKIIRSVEDGIVDRLFVDEGDTVAAGDPLVAFDRVSLQSQLLALEQRLVRAVVQRRRLTALIDQFDDPAGVPRPLARVVLRVEPDEPVDLVAEQQAVLDRTVDRFNAELAVLSRRLSEAEAQQTAVTAELATLRELTPLVDERLEGQRYLSERGSASRLQLLDVMDQAIEHRRSLVALEQRLGELAATASRLAAERSRLAAESAGTLVDEHAAVSAEIDQMRQDRIQLDDRMDRTILRAPVDGIVTNRLVNAEGISLLRGDEVMTIVPTNERRIVEALVPNEAIAFLAPGQRATLKLHTLPFQRYGTLAAAVVTVGATSREDADGVWRYPVRLEVTEPDRTSAGFPVLLQPGMTLEADIVTDRRTLAGYFLEPIQAHLGASFRER